MYEKNPKLCKCCGKVILYENKTNNFCNSSCSASFNNTGRKVDKTKRKIEKCLICGKETEIKLGTSKSKYHCEECKKELQTKRHIRNNKNNKNYGDKIICNLCGKEYIVINRSNYCSDECRKEIRSINAKNMMKERIKNGLHKGWQSRNIISYPEKFFIEVLKNNGLEKEYKFNFPINKREDLSIDEAYSYFLDFYFTEKKILLEIDGKQHEYRKEHDELRDERLRNIGIKIHRIKWKSINNEKGKEYIKNEIDKFLDFYNKN